MDLADASLVAVAESLKFRQIFTIDSDFFFYFTFRTLCADKEIFFNSDA
jgi:predicted nucleic acid-binding protein